MSALTIRDLYASVGDQEILKGVNLRIPRGEVHAVMGKNGSGKSTLAKIIAGHPSYAATSGSVVLDSRDLLGMEPNERACLGVFLAFQYPVEIPGVTVANFIRAAVQARLPEGQELEATQYYSALYQQMDSLQIPRAFTSRSVNEGFSGGEKKRCEILQMAMLRPAYAILDETDSGLDIDALKVVSDGVNALRGPHVGILIITHYQRLLNYIVPDRVHVMVGGRVACSGGRELALQLEAEGYDWLAGARPCGNAAAPC
ncbi:MAG: Fe-S cluster assembly ATPase SufC [Candidatus Xiphinematobacter sp.]|nr:MAG: Fe-S cluster assembly ATPase SufC [Candidatus Xiphinematobacter sp.]QQY10095.1 MAG: Fe-S cluster assembly ATPase SufC [Candidatus Xiphinematobacter sp.]QQY10829.1 MAG: Fe-S cluster assembly ATPase SufC [Candidatus Xiphinematobacter sp.]